MLTLMNDHKTLPLRAIVDPARCTGCEICTIICPEVFEMKDNGSGRIATVRDDRVPDEARNFCKDARDCCKAKAITLEEIH